MNPEEPTRNWEHLTQLAREARAPELDVSAAVLRAIRRIPPLEDHSLFGMLNSMIFSGWMRASMAVVTLGSVALGYEGYQNSDALMFALGFSF